MSDLQIRPVDPFDDPALDAWHGVYLAAERHGREDLATPWALEELRVQLQAPTRSRRSLLFLGEVAGEAVVAGNVQLRLLDNLSQAEVLVHTAPEHQRRGHGSALLPVLEQAAREHGRTVLASDTAWPHELGPTGDGAPGIEFARTHGYSFALGDVMRVLRLPVADTLLADLAAQAAPRHTAYSLRSWVGPVPDDLVQGWAELATTLMTEAPLGEMEREPEAVDIAALREGEELGRRQGRTKLNTVALDAEGTVVAYTDIATTVHEPTRAYQWGTLVRRADRGHRLGMAVKVANLALLQRETQGLESVVTWNAEVNDHMIGVNEQLGFRAAERLGELQKRLD
ncbi:GNAT family N-acetyltransferase [Nocardioides psychrotolerans]|uniref:Ribosomal protein S18 acetylase RimI n=1 Tax=Nocardioides psychrotolerans TaxID=1005945 RepID=A0A1I3BKU9_9ACTN|nr:GNAT family N-acetyltransferase [Nocardioides psychrotolerans]GEP36587.1 GNAT family N-acetyltransferase [Nocardioides psychrotolerans]SFH62790.1 Ribosomal protein S18 acetylase RimI [Nocardioides psychrotolerans]